ncbi:hypothetical protein BRADI_1g69005v3 [Brachypodium distachyon]|uniref:Uncharacterized protein n=1 Tax=Brachypodium distachyon TaxID=15368 RepID=A0A0Q3HIN9_BRADI|nr:hypothetical protein BRADI_1g69005v3 [Brachypodium distachyon]
MEASGDGHSGRPGDGAERAWRCGRGEPRRRPAIFLCPCRCRRLCRVRRASCLILTQPRRQEYCRGRAASAASASTATRPCTRSCRRCLVVCD